MAINIEEAVRTFMNAAGQTEDDSRRNLDLRFALMDEEHDEVVEAINHGDKVQVAKELCDLVYVVVGTAIAMGIPFNECFAALQTSNMTKVVDGKVVFREDGKVLKGEGYVPAEDLIRDILR